MASFHPGATLKHGRREDTGRRGREVDETLAPVIAGAFARGIAETMDLLGLPAVFLDASGEVLFASAAAAPLLRGMLRLHAGHLMAEHRDDNSVLASFIADSVGAGTGDTAARLPRSAITLRRLPRTKTVAQAGQMLRAVVLLADERDPRHLALLQLLA